MTTRRELLMPDLGLPDVPLAACVWLVRVGDAVHQGERLLEILAGEVTVDLPSPADGVLAEKCVAEDDPVHVGQALGIILVDSA